MFFDRQIPQNQRPRPACDAESGIAAIMLVLLIMAAVAGLIAMVFAHTALQSHQALLRNQQSYLDRGQSLLGNWYKANAAYVFTSAGQATLQNSGALLQAAGIPEEWNATATESAETCTSQPGGGNPICYYNLTLSIPGGNLSASISGETIEAKKFGQAVSQLDRMAAALQAGFSAFTASGGLHNTSLNWFAPPNCGSNGSGPFACSNGGFMSLDGWLANSGFGPESDGNNPWGVPVLAENDGGNANDQVSPYSIILESPLPWGGAIQQTVTQPL